MSSKWEGRRTELVTAIARNIGEFGVQWQDVAKEMGETAKACESAFWRINSSEDGQLGIDVRILKHRIKGTPYPKMLPDFPGYTIDKLRNRAAALAGTENNAWVNDERVAFFDLEFHGFDANFGVLLSWAIKHQDGPLVHDVITRAEAIDYDKMDRRLCESFVEELKNVDLLVGFYSTKMDVPYIRSRCFWWDVPFPLFGEKKHHDMYYTAKRVLKLHRGSQDAAARFLLKAEAEKNHVDMEKWTRARLGEKEALEFVLDHNDRDVRDLEKLYKILTPYVKMTRKSI